MFAKFNLTAVAAATAVLVTPMLASAMTTARGKSPPRGVHTPVVISPEGRVLGTDPSPAVRFELARDYARGR
jgi:hypothetical protein